ncbi:MAG TPA: S53 family peptidase [Chthoniobacterales bacterium]|jgi:kumamolisin
MALLISIGATSASAQSQALSTRHVRDAITQGRAALVQHLNPAQRLQLVIGLPLRDKGATEAFIENLYNPASPNYQHYLTGNQFADMFGPSQADYDAVVRFAQNNGFVVTSKSPNRLILQVEGNVASIERAFHVTMNVYKHPTENRTFYGPDREPTVDLSTKLWNINGLDNYAIPRPNLTQRPNAVEANTGSGPGGFFLGSDLRAAYYGTTGTLNGSGQKLGLLEYVGTNPADYINYFNMFGPPLTTTVTLLSTDGTPALCTTCSDAEQSLDIEFAISMAPGLSQVIVYVGSTDQAMLSRMVTDNSCKVISCSWSWKPADPQVDDPLFLQMASQGQTFAAASGDSASWGAGEFNWPQEDGNILSVGGTHLVTAGPGGAWSSETGWSLSGGGISIDTVPLPSYQQNKAVVNAQNHASRTMRNGPDVAMEGDFQNYICHDGGCDGGWGGTSFAAPEWAGYLSLANQQATTQSKPTVGFVNPTLYKVGEKTIYTSNFHDILTGSNSGFSCVAGFDLVTGWGSPNGPTLINTIVR